MEAYYQMLWQRRGGDSFQAPCFINVNTVTGQNDKSQSGMHNYPGPWKIWKWRAEEERKKGPDRCSEVNCSGEMSLHYVLSSPICHLRSLLEDGTSFPHASFMFLSNLIIFGFPSHTLSAHVCIIRGLEGEFKLS